MKRCTLLLCLCAAPLSATMIQDTITDAEGNPVTGYCMVAAAVPFSSPSAGFRVVGQPVTISFSGTFTATLVPTDASGSYYEANCQNTTGSWSITGAIWLVPVTTSTLTLNDITVATPPAANYTIPWQQLAQDGATIGQAPVWNGTAYVPASIPGLSIVPANFGGLGLDASAFNGVLLMANGLASTVTGNSTDCVLVNGTSGPCGSGLGNGQHLTWAAAGGLQWDTI